MARNHTLPTPIDTPVLTKMREVLATLDAIHNFTSDPMNAAYEVGRAMGQLRSAIIDAEIATEKASR